MTKTFKGRTVLKGIAEGEAVVSRNGFNAYASFYTSLGDGVQTAICADSGNPDTYGKELSGKILCIPHSTGSTSAGAVWQRIARLGIAPKAVLFSQGIDSLAAGGLIVADKWAGIRICTIDQLGVEFLESVQDGDTIKIQEDGAIIIN
jgi:predicted aconitase with swiveling domain